MAARLSGAFGPRHVEASVRGGYRSWTGGGSKTRLLRTLFERRDVANRDRPRKRFPAVDGLRYQDRVGFRRGRESAPHHVQRAGPHIERHRRTLIERVAAADRDRRAPRRTAIDRTREPQLRSGGDAVARCNVGVHDIDVSAEKKLTADRAQLRAGARNVGQQAWLVEK